MDQGAVNAKGQTLEAFLQSYDPAAYPRPSVTVDMVVFTLLEGRPLRLGVLLIRRGDHPYINMWAVPGGFINMDEHLIDAAYRELYEETGVNGARLFELAPFDAPDRDPRTRVISFGYYALVPMGSLNPAAGDDAADARLFAVEVARERAGDGVRTLLSLNSGETHIQALLRTGPVRRGSAVEQRTRIVDPGELAGDHALILERALHRLRTLPPRQAVAPMLPPVFSRRMVREACRAVYGTGTMEE